MNPIGIVVIFAIGVGFGVAFNRRRTKVEVGGILTDLLEWHGLCKMTRTAVTDALKRI